MTRMRMIHSGVGTFALLLALGIAAPAQADMNAAWGDFDANSDGSLTNREFSDGLFNTWDANDDDRIAMDEYGDHELFGDVEFNDYDKNADGFWDRGEYDSAYGESEIYDEYADGSAGIRKEEFATFYDDAGDAGLFDV